VAVTRRAGDAAHGRRLRELIIVLWRAGLRTCEALALSEADLDRRRESLLVRRGQGRPAPQGRYRRLGVGTARNHGPRPESSGRSIRCFVVTGAKRGRPWAAAAASLRAAPPRPPAPRARRFASHAVDTAREGVPLHVI
jgi:hypothetical protein